MEHSRVDLVKSGACIKALAEILRPSHPSMLRGGMNPRVSPNHPRRCWAPAALLAVGALLFHGESARAGCMSGDHRPALPLGGAQVAPTDEPPPPPVQHPTCSGPSCSRDKIPSPIAPTVKLVPRVDLCTGSQTDRAPVNRPGRPIERRRGLTPIGRVTDIDRPPSGHA
jgi:hypothetical protein